MARIPNEDLLKLRDTFGIDEQFLLSDLNDYTMEGPGNDVIPIEDGIASIDTDLPIYTQDRDGGNNFLQYSDEGAPAYIRDREPAAPINYKLQDPTIMKMANFDELFGPKTFTDSLGNVRTVPGEERFSFPKEKTGILQTIKDGGSKLLDFIKGGGVVGGIIKGLLPEQSPEAIFMRDYYGGEDGSNIKNGTIQSGLMAGYNPISGGLFGSPVTYGLQNAYDRRIATIRKTLARKYGDPNYKGDATKLDERLEKLIEEKRKEAEALRIATETRQREAQESQKQADQARINRAYREETGGQGGSYATGESGIQRDSRGREVGYNDPFDPGGGE
jgi:hypothetical protein